MIWFTSDLHLGHTNIIVHTHRPWATVTQMDDALIRNVNACARRDDTLYVLGDVSFRMRVGDVAALLSRIRCRHMVLVNGNHDKDWSQAGVFEDVRDYLEIKAPGGRRLCLFHYPLMTWNGMYRGAIQLHGHIHSEGPSYNERNRDAHLLRYDVGVDANDYRPVSLDEVLRFFDGVDPIEPAGGGRPR